MKRFFVIIPILLLVLVLSIWAAWAATDNFDSYTATENLNTKNGGTGWTGAWTTITGAWTVETAPAGMSGNVARSLNSSSEYSRAFTSTSSGTVSFKIRLTASPPSGAFSFALYDSGSFKMSFQAATDGNFKIWNNGTFDTIQAFAADTTYTITIDFDDANHPNQYRAKVDAGSYTAYKDVNGASYTAVDSLRIEWVPSTSTVYIDDIAAVAPTAFPAHYYRMMSSQ